MIYIRWYQRNNSGKTCEKQCRAGEVKNSRERLGYNGAEACVDTPSITKFQGDKQQREDMAALL
ncbi:MAG: hypothetical protein IJ587_00155 [Synergistaceae bacterium]|nr:hypothetical protein [Synergistaceae bacterium]